ncbi:MAG: hypothetical protein ABUL77_00105 [Bacteroidota bacterium]
MTWLVVLWLAANTPAAAAGAAAATAAATVAVPASRAGGAPASAPLGVSYGGWKGQFNDAAGRLAKFKDIGFRVVSFVPTYAYEGLDKINVASGPDPVELGRAVEAALRAGFSVVVKPHLDPPAYGPGFAGWKSENYSWRAHCPWRGFFDVDPMGAAYREGIVFASLRALKDAFDGLGAGAAAVPAVRLEVGAELMNAVVYTPERWVTLLAAAKKERHRLGLDGRVLLSHNFTHHLEIPEDFVGRMDPPRRSALKRYIRGLDALALSQYMDLTAAMPAGERDRRLPSVDEVAQALLAHERNFRKDILQGALGLRADEIPPFHIGEFGVGRGGLRHPNLWDGAATPAEEKELAREITRGHEGLLRYLALPAGRTAGSAVLWVTGPHYDVFGWDDAKNAIPEAAAAIKQGLRR